MMISSLISAGRLNKRDNTESMIPKNWQVIEIDLNRSTIDSQHKFRKEITGEEQP